MYSGDFVKLTAALDGVPGANAEEKAGTGEEWTDAEILLLLEGIELYDDDWVAVAEHVGSKSREACVLQFLRLPIEDGFDEPGAPGTGATNEIKQESEGDLGLLRYGRIPFDKTDNPVLSVATFLAGVKGAETAGAKPASAGDVKSEAMDVEPSSSAPKASGGGTLKSTLALPQTSRAAHLALQHTANAASALADEEETKIRSALGDLVKAQIRKLELKMGQFEEMEEALEEERRAVEGVRMRLGAERRKVGEWLDRLAREMQQQQQQGLPPGGVAMNQMIVQGAQLLAVGSGGRLQVVPVDPTSGAMEGEGGPVSGGVYGTLV
jgi:SWI/SNF related-matrix-associated actin-dependent regulator of chromatin subfamily C